MGKLLFFEQTSKMLNEKSKSRATNFNHIFYRCSMEQRLSNFFCYCNPIIFVTTPACNPPVVGDWSSHFFTGFQLYCFIWKLEMFTGPHRLIWD